MMSWRRMGMDVSAWTARRYMVVVDSGFDNKKAPLVSLLVR